MNLWKDLSNIVDSKGDEEVSSTQIVKSRLLDILCYETPTRRVDDLRRPLCVDK